MSNPPLNVLDQKCVCVTIGCGVSTTTRAPSRVGGRKRIYDRTYHTLVDSGATRGANAAHRPVRQSAQHRGALAEDKYKYIDKREGVSGRGGSKQARNVASSGSTAAFLVLRIGTAFRSAIRPSRKRPHRLTNRFGGSRGHRFCGKRAFRAAVGDGGASGRRPGGTGAMACGTPPCRGGGAAADDVAVAVAVDGVMTGPRAARGGGAPATPAPPTPKLPKPPPP